MATSGNATTSESVRPVCWWWAPPYVRKWTVNPEYPPVIVATGGSLLVGRATTRRWPSTANTAVSSKSQLIQWVFYAPWEISNPELRPVLNFPCHENGIARKSKSTATGNGNKKMGKTWWSAWSTGFETVPPPRQLAVEQTATVMAATGRIAAAIHNYRIHQHMFTAWCQCAPHLLHGSLRLIHARYIYSSPKRQRLDLFRLFCRTHIVTNGHKDTQTDRPRFSKYVAVVRISPVYHYRRLAAAKFSKSTM